MFGGVPEAVPAAGVVVPIAGFVETVAPVVLEAVATDVPVAAVAFEPVAEVDAETPFATPVGAVCVGTADV